ncbi:transposase [Bacillus cereus]|nr:transposase [Bacillus cereus]
MKISHVSCSSNHFSSILISLRKLCSLFMFPPPRVITVDKNPAYLIAIEKLKKEKKMPAGSQTRQIKYLNNIVEQDHRFIKRRIRSMLGLKSFRTAVSILSGVEAMHMIKKEQIDLQNQSVQNRNIFIHQLFGLAA